MAVAAGLGERVASDPELALLARGLTAVVRLGLPDSSLAVRFEDGAVTAAGAVADGDDADLRIEAGADVWRRLLSADHDDAASFAGSVLSGELAVAPSLERPEVFRYNGALQRLIALAGDATDPVPDPPLADHGAIRGRYLPVSDDDISYRVFVQEAGAGEPVLFLHPGGGDSRVWSHLLADPRLQRRFRLLAIDLPYHGRSLPPTEGPGWWRREYGLDADQAGRWVTGACDSLGLERPLLVGLGLGAQLAIHLLGSPDDRFRGAVALNASSPAPAAKAGFALDSLFHPRVSRRAGGAWIAGFMPLAVPAARRHEAEWIFASAGPSVLKGDTALYQSGFDLGAALERVRAPLLQVVGQHHPGQRAGAERVLAGRGYLAPLEDPAGFNREIAELIAATLETATTGGMR